VFCAEIKNEHMSVESEQFIFKNIKRSYNSEKFTWREFKFHYICMMGEGKDIIKLTAKE